MSRLPRYLIPGQPQHIIQRGNNRQVIFAADEDYQFFRDAVVEATQSYGLAIHAYVWMTNHVHILATSEFEHSISKVFQSVGRRYVQYFNFTYHRTGTLWEGRYRATVVDSEQYLLTLMRYIELNPVRAGMVAQPEDYPWSSHRRNAQGESGKNADWISPHGEYLRLGHDAVGRRESYRNLFHAAISSNDLREIRECTHKGWALGNERFREQVEALGKRRATSKGVGRPRKDKIVSDPNCPTQCDRQP
ncbi:MAG: transposase [Gammaproteobacteria bacterium]|nr:transposase [Gammaproteobacteria bacterium]